MLAAAAAVTPTRYLLADSNAGGSSLPALDGPSRTMLLARHEIAQCERGGLMHDARMVRYVDLILR